jgi:hypothetical protein
MRNTSTENAELSARVAGLLVPLDGGQGMSITNWITKPTCAGKVAS